MDAKKTGELIRALRTELGLTQQQLACRLHVGDKAVSKWERGGGCPDVSLLPALAEVLGVGLEAVLSCCGRPLAALEPRKAEEAHRLTLEPVENELFVTSGHPMEKEHYLTFLALLQGDTLLLRRLYPEWELQARLPAVHGRLLWYCTRHGLFYQNI